MALVSPGVQVTVTDESFFVPAVAPTVPLIFIATKAEKTQPDGVTPAAGTYESGVVRTVTSLNQSVELYGEPIFHTDENGVALHGDARNEYGLLALNQFLGVGNRAYVVRACINLDDDLDALREIWDAKMTNAASLLTSLVNEYITEYNETNGLIPADVNYKLTVNKDELVSLAHEATRDVWSDCLSFHNSEFNFFDDNSLPSSATAGYQVINFNGRICQGQQEIDFGGILQNNTPTGLDVGTDYTFTVTVDNASVETVLVSGADAQTFGELVTMLNAELNGVTVGIVNGNLLLWSDSVSAGSPVSSNVDIYDDGASLVGSPALNTLLTALRATSPAPVLRSSTLCETSPTGLENDNTEYSLVVSVNGQMHIVEVVGSAAQTYGALVTQLNSELSGLAQVTLEEGNLVVTSNSTGVGSSINISNSAVTPTPLLSNLAWFVGLGTPVDGVAGDAPLNVYANGYDLPATGTYDGFEGMAAEWVSNGSGDIVVGEWSGEEAADMLLAAADDYKFTVEFLNETSLGANDAARRAAVVAALQRAINSNTEIRSDAFEYNLVVAPGYHEVVDELAALVTDIAGEAFVIADTPMNLSPSEVVEWASTSARVSSPSVAYYYPHGFGSNLDGQNVLGAASGVALRTYAYSDNVSEVWFAPAGTRRGLVTGVSMVGYVGSDGEFVETNLNQGQMDDLYKYFTNINPIVFFQGRGLVVWGQKTSAPAASALDRVKVARLVAFVRRQLRKNLLPFVFEPNDALTRDNVKATVDNFLGDLIVRRALYDFATVVDESNNTPDRIDRNELWVDIALQPVKDAEFIMVPIRIVSTGTEI